MDKKWWTLSAVCGGTFMLLLDTTIVYVVLPAARGELHASFADVQWVIDAYALALASLLLTAGTAADRFGRRRLYSVGVVVFTTASLLCGLAASPIQLILARAAQGIGGSMMFATGLALLAGAFQGRERGLAFGVWGLVTGLASAIGPVAGGLLTSGFGWRAVFLVNIPIGAAVALVVQRHVDESRSPLVRRLDWPGFALFTMGLAGIVHGLVRAGEVAWGDGRAQASLAAGAMLLLAFVVIEAKTAQPMFDLHLLRVPTFVGGLIAAFAMNGSLFAMFLFLAMYLQDVLGLTALETGLRLLTASLPMLVASVVAGRLIGQVPTRILIGAGLMVVGLGLFLMAGVSPSTGWAHFVPGLAVGGLGAGLVNPPLASTAVGVVDQSRSGMASGMNSTFRQLGTGSSIAVLGSVFAAIVGNRVVGGLDSVPGLAGRGEGLAAQVRAGQIRQAVSSTPPEVQDRFHALAVSGFVEGINTLVVIGGAVAVAGGVLALALIRGRDFTDQSAPADDDPRAAPAAHVPAAATNR